MSTISLYADSIRVDTEDADTMKIVLVGVATNEIVSEFPINELLDEMPFEEIVQYIAEKKKDDEE